MMPLRYPSILNQTPEQRHVVEVALPPIFTSKAQRDSGQWPNNFYSDRIDWYTQLCIEVGSVRGGPAVIPEFISAMIAEAALDNRKFGDSNAASIHFGVGWMQFDTEFHVFTLENLLAIRQDPIHSLLYATDPDNGLCTQGGAATHFIKQRWNAWRQDVIDPTTGWSALGAAISAYERAVA